MQKKTCTKCGLDKPLHEFHVDKGGKFGRRSDCKSCNILRAKQHSEANRERVLAVKKLYRAKNKQSISEKKMQWNKNNHCRIVEYSKKYIEENKGRRAATQSMRRALKIKATPTWFSEFDLFVAVEAAELCGIRQSETGFSWQVDHMIPLKAVKCCGLHCADNLQVIPAIMNVKKRNKMALTNRLEWLKDGI